MTRTGCATLTLAELDDMPIEEAQALPFDDARPAAGPDYRRRAP